MLTKRLMSLCLSLLLMTGCAGSSLSTKCADAGGKWLAAFSECEDVSRVWCDDQQGAYSECGSACRHEPEVMMCTMQCIQVCGFDA